MTHSIGFFMKIIVQSECQKHLPNIENVIRLGLRLVCSDEKLLFFEQPATVVYFQFIFGKPQQRMPIQKSLDGDTHMTMSSYMPSLPKIC